MKTVKWTVLNIENDEFKTKPTSFLQIGGLKLYTRVRFNWIQRLLWKALGIKVENLKEKKCQKKKRKQ